jgi:hypothetical protein
MEQRIYTLDQAHEDGWRGSDATYFAAFLNAVNSIVVKETDFTIWDFVDWDWTEAFYSGKSVADVADDFLSFIDMEYGMNYNSVLD